MKPSTSTPRRKKTPSYRRQRRKNGSDLAFVEIDGRRHYLGPYETAASREQYHRLIAEWEAAGGDLLERTSEFDARTTPKQTWILGRITSCGKLLSS